MTSDISSGAVKTSSGSPSPDYGSPAQDMEPVQEQRDQIDAVGGHDDGDAVLPVQPGQELHHPVFSHRVEPGRRLVQEQNFVAHGEETGNADAFFLAETQVVDGFCRQYSTISTFRSAALTRSATSDSAKPILRGPNATSSKTVWANSWSSGFWKTMPTLR